MYKKKYVLENIPFITSQVMSLGRGIRDIVESKWFIDFVL